MQKQISCIIPFYNEGQRLYAVLDEIVKVRGLAQIICVDDFSAEDMTAEIQKRYPKIKTLRLQKNVGKSDAIRAGLRNIATELVLLFDADLRNVNHMEVEAAASAMQRGQDIDMLILRRVNAARFIKINRSDVLFSGERILKKQDLEKILSGAVHNWQLESAMNSWMYERQKRVFWLPHSGVNTHKPWKLGFFKGLRIDMKTIGDIISGAGIVNLLKQTLFFAKYRLPEG